MIDDFRTPSSSTNERGISDGDVIGGMPTPQLADWVEHCLEQLVASDMQYLLAAKNRLCWWNRLRDAEEEVDRRRRHAALGNFISRSQ